MVQAAHSRGFCQPGDVSWIRISTLSLVVVSPGNKGKLVGQKAALRLKEIWALRIRLQLAERVRELAEPARAIGRSRARPGVRA